MMIPGHPQNWYLRFYDEARADLAAIQTVSIGRRKVGKRVIARSRQERRAEIQRILASLNLCRRIEGGARDEQYLPFYQFGHVLPEHVVCTAATRLLDEFVADGGEPEGLDYADFVPAAVETWADDRVQRARTNGLLPAVPHWRLMANGDAQVAFPFPSEAQAVLFKALVL